MKEFTEKIDAPKTNNEVVEWIISHLKKNSFLLAFADDGVIWGNLKDGTNLVISNHADVGLDKSAISPSLRGRTLQQAFIFNDKEEIRLFHDEMHMDDDIKWQARKVIDLSEVIKESQILWGDRAYSSKLGFTHIFDARQQGLDQIIPIEVENSQLEESEEDAGNKVEDKRNVQRIRLDIHHSVAYNENGEAYIAVSRLAGLRIGNRNEEVYDEHSRPTR